MKQSRKSFGTLLPNEGDTSLFSVHVISEKNAPDFYRYEQVIGTFADLPKGLVWAHHVDHEASVSFETEVEVCVNHFAKGHIGSVVQMKRKLATR